jgi:hypothetical protein
MSVIEIPLFIHRNGTKISRKFLPDDDPESIYNYIKNVIKKRPESFGIYKRDQKYLCFKKDELIKKILELEDELNFCKKLLKI